jgi:hypothetical protein
MANFTTKDLAFIGYSQTIDLKNNILSKEIIERTYINKKEEFEVVHFCNQFLEKYNVPKTRVNFQKVEELLQDATLEHAISKDHIFDWIATNWVKI